MTFFLETIRLGFANLIAHKLRSLLTALGIICGVVAVIIMIAIGEGTKARALAEIRQLGARNIIVQSQKPDTVAPTTSQSSRSFVLAYGLTRQDQQRIEMSVDHVEAVVPLKQVARKAVYRDRQSSAQVFGTTPRCLDVTRLVIDRGRYLGAVDLEGRRNVAVLGAAVAERLFLVEDPLSQSVRIDGQVFRVTGVLKPTALAGGTGPTQLGRDLDYDVHIPLSTAQSRFGDTSVQRESGSFNAEKTEISELYVRVEDEAYVVAVAEQIRRLVELSHDKAGAVQDVKMIVPLELLNQRKRTLTMFNLLMAAIAAISLFVGGIGIMNIMLASVTERTREIGIRRAVGATRSAIIMQFLIETTMLSVVGGLIGVAMGVGGAELLQYLHERLPQHMGTPQWTGWSVIASFIVAAVVGVVFGLYPAVKAAQQDPIVALRHE